MQGVKGWQIATSDDTFQLKLNLHLLENYYILLGMVIPSQFDELKPNPAQGLEHNLGLLIIGTTG